jgi:peptidoglycan-N-acetylglucosamine deacetylase
MRQCAVSVDLDEIGCYRALFGLSPVEAGQHAVYDVALERIAAFAQHERIPLSFFAIGRDLERCRAADRLVAALVEAPHLVENHSWAHRYDLSQLSRPAIAAEVRRGADAIEAVTGRRPRGFRAPGYCISDHLLDALVDEGVRFDSSVFPCPSYVAVKTAAMLGLRARGRSTAAILSDPRVVLAPADPYRPGRPWFRRGERDLVELPIAVTQKLRLPLIGTALSLAGRRGAGLLTRAAIGRPVVSLELHGLDFLDEADGLSDLAPHQRDLHVPHAEKRARLGTAIAELRAAGYAFVTAAHAAHTVA